MFPGDEDESGVPGVFSLGIYGVVAFGISNVVAPGVPDLFFLLVHSDVAHGMLMAYIRTYTQIPKQ